MLSLDQAWLVLVTDDPDAIGARYMKAPDVNVAVLLLAEDWLSPWMRLSMRQQIDHVSSKPISSDYLILTKNY